MFTVLHGSIDANKEPLRLRVYEISQLVSLCYKVWSSEKHSDSKILIFLND